MPLTTMADQPTLAESLSWGEIRLRSAGVPEPRSDARILLCAAAETTREILLTSSDAKCHPLAAERFARFIALRAQRIPLPYITGGAEFFKRRFAIEPGALIPRPETETLVERALVILAEMQHPRVLDVGCGSGVIGISIAAEHPDAPVILTDAFSQPVQVAQSNAVELLGGRTAARRVRLVRTNLADGLDLAAFHLICANLPYVPSKVCAVLEPEIACYEPREALDGGPNGLALVGLLAKDVAERARCGTYLLLEVGFGQAETVVNLLHDLGFADIRCIKDIAGIDRVVEGRVG